MTSKDKGLARACFCWSPPAAAGSLRGTSPRVASARPAPSREQSNVEGFVLDVSEPKDVGLNITVLCNDKL